MYAVNVFAFSHLHVRNSSLQDIDKIAHLPGNSPVDFSHKGQWRGALMFSLICAWINGWVNNREGGDLRRHGAHCDVIVMWGEENRIKFSPCLCILYPLSYEIVDHLHVQCTHGAVYPASSAKPPLRLGRGYIHMIEYGVITHLCPNVDSNLVCSSYSS